MTEEQFIRYNQLKDLLDQLQSLLSEMENDERKESIKFAEEKIQESK